jgi:hypothetical protein
LQAVQADFDPVDPGPRFPVPPGSPDVAARWFDAGHRFTAVSGA